ncbi:MAG: DUF402 domain-containing protein [Dehalococcoidia bacterium]
MTDERRMAGDQRWPAGAAIVLRYITRDGRPGMSWPCTLVEDRDDLVVLYIPEGTTFKAWGTAGTPPARRLVDSRWRHDVLRLMFPDCGYSIWLFWRRDQERHFTGYYVNFEEPFRRTAIGFDTNDHMLDIVVTPELTWSWKDAEDFDARVQDGIYSSEFAVAVRAEAERVIAAIEARRPPFGDGWERWLPDPNWTVPELPPAWETEPAALWEHRRWAYLSAR